MATDSPPTIDPLDDDLLTFSQAAKLLSVSPPTVWRYATQGKRGVKLPTIPWGSKRVTTAACIRWWFAQLQARDAQADGPPSRRAVDARIDAECEAAGI